jgi:hypothetical protein
MVSIRREMSDIVESILSCGATEETCPDVVRYLAHSYYVPPSDQTEADGITRAAERITRAVYRRIRRRLQAGEPIYTPHAVPPPTVVPPHDPEYVWRPVDPRPIAWIGRLDGCRIGVTTPLGYATEETFKYISKHQWRISKRRGRGATHKVMLDGRTVATVRGEQAAIERAYGLAIGLIGDAWSDVMYA